MVRSSTFAVVFALVASSTAQPFGHGARRMHRVKRQQVVGASVVPLLDNNAPAPAPVDGIGANFVGGPSVVPVATPAALGIAAAATSAPVEGVGAQALGPVSVIDSASSSSDNIATATLTSTSSGAVQTDSANGAFQNLGVEAKTTSSSSELSSTDVATSTSSSVSASPTEECEEDEPMASANANLVAGDDDDDDNNDAENTDDCADEETASDDASATSSTEDSEDEPVATKTVTIFIDPTDLATVPVSNVVVAQTSAPVARRRSQQRRGNW